MNSRERVFRALKKHDGYPDRVPVQFDLCKQLTDELSELTGIGPHYCQHTFEDITYRISSNELRTHLGSDMVIVGASVSETYLNNLKINADGTWLDEHGLVMKKGEKYCDIVDAPLKNATSVSDVKKYKFLDPHDSSRYEECQRVIEKFKEDYFIIGDLEPGSPMFPMLLVGMEKYMIDLQLGEEYLDYLAEKHTDNAIEFGLRLIKLGVDGIWCGDDYGGQNGIIYNPVVVRDRILPYHAKMVKAFKAAKPDIVLFFHCCGAAKPVLRDIAKVGYDCYNAVQPFLPGNDPQELKDYCGDVLSFWGGIDPQSILPRGSDEELEQHIQQYMEVMGKDRGYICAPAHIIQMDTSVERVLKFVELCKKHSYQYNFS